MQEVTQFMRPKKWNFQQRQARANPKSVTGKKPWTKIAPAASDGRLETVLRLFAYTVQH